MIRRSLDEEDEINRLTKKRRREVWTTMVSHS